MQQADYHIIEQRALLRWRPKLRMARDMGRNSATAFVGAIIGTHTCNNQCLLRH